MAPQFAYVLTYSHEDGDIITLHATEPSARKGAAAIARSFWAEIAAVCDEMPPTPGGLTDSQVTAMYFRNRTHERYDIERQLILSL